MRNKFSTNSLHASPAFFNFSIIVDVKTGSFFVTLFGLPSKLSEFNNIGSPTGILHVTSLFIRDALKFSSPNFDILEISSYTISLKVSFSLLSTVNLFKLNGFVRIDVFKRKTWAENWFWKALLSSWCFKGSKSSSTSGVLSYSLMIRDSSHKHSSHVLNQFYHLC